MSNLNNEYTKRVFEKVVKNNQGENEYIQAVLEFLSSIENYIDKHPELEQNSLLERLVEPERLIEFRVSWVDDNNKVQVNKGYRVQFNSAIGPYKGGLRFHPTVNRSIMKFLGFEQILKNSLTGLPLGGAKGGSDFDPKGKSDNEIMRFCQSFMSELYRHIGQFTDVPAGDIGVGAREIGYLFGYYKKLKNEYSGVLTGKGLSYGGSLVRKEATGYGLCYFTNKMLEVMKNDSFKNKKVIISGSGNVALYALQKATELGATVIAMSDSNGYIYNEKGIDFKALQEIKEQKRLRIREYLNYDNSTIYSENPKAIWKLKADIALPCATQNEIGIEEAKAIVSNGFICVSEGANMPSTLEATNYFIEHKLCYGPAKAANAGGVLTSGFEMTQNSLRLPWSALEVDARLKKQMENIFNQVHQTALEYSNEFDTVTGANIAGFERVAKAMLEQGVI